MSNQSKRWSVVAAAISARMDELGISRAELQRQANISDKTMARYLDGEPIIRKDKRYDLARALGWTPNSIDRMLDGEAPTLEEPPLDEDRIAREFRLLREAILAEIRKELRLRPEVDERLSDRGNG